LDTVAILGISDMMRSFVKGGGNISSAGSPMCAPLDIDMILGRYRKRIGPLGVLDDRGMLDIIVVAGMPNKFAALTERDVVLAPAGP